jgi:site-specific DNA-methyltransferase (adenine-specific)
VTPPSGLVLDPFSGSGTTLEAAYSLGFRVVGIDTEAEYLEDAKRRLHQAALLLG